MSVTALSDDSHAIALLCSSLALPQGVDARPLSPSEWSSLAAMIHCSELERPGALLGISQATLQQKLELSRDSADRLTALLRRGGQLALELDRLAARGIWLVTRADDAYPPRLKERLKNTAPPLLFVAGRLALLLERGIAVIGSRDADESSLSFATLLGRRSAEAGFAIVSGAARGVDSAAMVATAEAGGDTIGIVADALEKMTRRREFREHLVDGNMALISPYHPAARFTVANAMRRNRLIYCFADAAVVVAAGETGGTFAGALENLKASWTPLFVRADDDAPPGNRNLLAQGALPLRDEEVDSGDAISRLLARAQAEDGRQRALDAPNAEQSTGDTATQPDRRVMPPVAQAAAEDQLKAPTSDKVFDGVSTALTEVARHDALVLTWPHLERFLGEARTESEIAGEFALERSQVRAWMARAVEEGLVDKLERPVRYRLKAARPPELFGL